MLPLPATPPGRLRLFGSAFAAALAPVLFAQSAPGHRPAISPPASAAPTTPATLPAAAAPAAPAASAPPANSPPSPYSSSATTATTASRPAMLPLGESAWLAVQDAVRTAGRASPRPGHGPGPGPAVSADRASVARSRQDSAAAASRHRSAAQQAREFAARYPAHPHANEARTLSVLADLHGLLPTDRPHRESALARAAELRRDHSQPLPDRIAVAHAVEAEAILRLLPGRPWHSNPVLAEPMLAGLRREFGSHPDLWSLHLAFAENTHCDAGRDAAQFIVQAPDSPAATRLAASRILRRYALVRQTLDFPLTPLAGPATTLAAAAGNTTVVCLWDSARHPSGPPGLHDYRRKSRPDTRWILVAVGPPPPASKGRRDFAAPAGALLCTEPLGWNSPLVTRLELAQLPYVFVLDDRRRVSGYGRIDDLPHLFAGIGRPALP